MRVLGIDPGFTGAFAIIDRLGPGRFTLRDVFDVPMAGEKSRKRVNVGVYMDWLNQHMPIDVAIIERAMVLPGVSVVAAGAYMRCAGYLESVPQVAGIRLEFAEPAVWKRHFKLSGPARGGTKDDSRQLALQKFPAQHTFFARKLDHNRAEAALIGLYGAIVHGAE